MIPVIDITPTYIAVLHTKGAINIKFHSIQRYGKNLENNIILSCTTDEAEIILQRCTTEESEAILGKVPASWNHINNRQDIYKILLPQ